MFGLRQTLSLFIDVSNDFVVMFVIGIIEIIAELKKREWKSKQNCK